MRRAEAVLIDVAAMLNMTMRPLLGLCRRALSSSSSSAAAAVPAFQVTTLANGLRVCSRDGPGPVAAVGVLLDAGSRYETPETNGVTHLLDRLAFKVRRRPHVSPAVR
jgi:predicted Zn-dependent peptidase